MTIVSILGLGRFNRETGNYSYEEATYRWDHFPDKPVKTRVIQQAFREWYPEAGILVLTTEEAFEHTWPKVKPLGNVQPEKIPKGSAPEEFWQIYNTITQAIPEGAKVVLDITHGLRSIPVLTLLALAFLRAARRIQLEAVVYAAQDAKTPEGITPIFDLTPFLTMLDWASATNRFLETGDARRFKELLIKSKQQALKSLGGDLEKFTNALVLNRTTEVSEYARGLLKSIREARDETYSQPYQPLRLLEDRLEKSIAPIANEKPIHSQFSQIAWYANQQQYAQAIALAREWMISVRIWKTDGWFSVNKEERRLAEDWLTTFAKVLETKSKAEEEAEKAGDKDKHEREKEKRLSVIPPQWTNFLKLWQRVSDQRNDYAHFGMRKQQTSTDTTLKKAKSLPKDLVEAVRPLGLELPEET